MNDEQFPGISPELTRQINQSINELNATVARMRLRGEFQRLNEARIEAGIACVHCGCNGAHWSRCELLLEHEAEIARLTAIANDNPEFEGQRWPSAPITTEIAEGTFSDDDRNLLSQHSDELEVLAHTIVSDEVLAVCRAEMEQGRRAGWKTR